MNTGLANIFVDRIQSGLRRSGISKCSQWAEMYRVMGPPFPGKFNFLHHPWTKAAHDFEEELGVCKKGAQTGFTETGLNKAFYTIDVRSSSVLYILPASTPDATDFSAARFDPALEASEHLRKMFSDVRNVGHKRAGNASLYIRGSRSRSQMKSVPASLLVFDELDEMNQDNVVLARERTSGQNVSQEFMLSTPHIENHGIDVYWQQSTQEHYFFHCPHCGRLEKLTFPDSLVITTDDPNSTKIEESYLICTQCKHPLDNDAKQEWLGLDNCIWVPEYSDRSIRGWTVSQLYSMARASRPAAIAKAILEAEHNPAREQELFNSKMGMCHTVKGAKIDDDDINAAMTTTMSASQSDHSGWYTMGVDVGPKYLNVEIGEYLKTNQRKINYDMSLATMYRVMKACKVTQFEQLDELMRKYKIMYCVIDAQPETRKALEFAQRFLGRVSLCYYTDTRVKTLNEDKKNCVVTADRTLWLDTSLGRFKKRSIRLPADTDLEYKDNIKAPVRIYQEDANGNPTGRYVNGNKPDHYAHSRNYSEIAFALALSVGGNQDITSHVN
jgi:hypothetical protein